MADAPDLTASWDPKGEAMRLWGADPCGGAIAAHHEGSAEFFAEVDRLRYDQYAPWLRQAAEFGAHQGERVLEIGCGMGTDLAQFVRGGAITFGLDLTTRHLGIARARLELEGVSPRLVRADAECLPIRSGSLDVVYSFGVLHHTPGIEAAIQEIHRVLRPGGTFLLGLYHRDSAFYWLNTLLVWGILHGRLFRDGYRRLMGDIERHDHTDALPLVNVYSRRQVRHLLSRFSAADVTAHHFEAGHLSYLEPAVRGVSRATLERIGRRWGWYVIARATR
ncbi:MAG TPA: class I SAM-dependent methyltransferase [Chloroflexota bacterium]|jgi:SAM-dependent methyltransferase|nr:class I SAM-dependent methyltransferase [Chloroflexota bacterium]